MAGLSIWHIGLFAMVLILLFGTSKLKNLGKDLGGAVRDFKDTVNQDDQNLNKSVKQDTITHYTMNSSQSDDSTKS